MSLKTIFIRLAAQGESGFDTIKQALSERLQLDNRPHIRPYFGYGTTREVFLKGRVLQSKPIAAAQTDDSIWDNLVRTYQFIESDEIPFAEVRAAGFGQSQIVTANDEGFVDIGLPLPSSPSNLSGWHEITLELLKPAVPELPPVMGQVFIPSPTAGLGVISDIDDTILHSNATNLLTAVRLMFLENAHTRLPFPGVAEFYQGLQQGGSQYPGVNPIFYVSSSPWNLFDLLTDFMELQEIPRGPLFLKDYGITPTQFLTSGHGAHKLARIDRLLTLYPHLPFILIGDSGQKDPEIYLETAERHPGRILAIYIRDVTPDKRDREVEQIAAKLALMGIDLLYSADSGRAAVHAAQQGYITTSAAALVQTAVESESPPI